MHVGRDVGDVRRFGAHRPVPRERAALTDPSYHRGRFGDRSFGAGTIGAMAHAHRLYTTIDDVEEGW
ncbi:hypothetical protein GCM10009780_67830 [Actinomadura alba]